MKLKKKKVESKVRERSPLIIIKNNHNTKFKYHFTKTKLCIN